MFNLYKIKHQHFLFTLPFIINVEINVSIEGKTEKLVIKFSFHNLTHPNHTKIHYIKVFFS